MIPLDLADIGKENVIKKVGGSPDVKKHLEESWLYGWRPGDCGIRDGRQRNSKGQGITDSHKP